MLDLAEEVLELRAWREELEARAAAAQRQSAQDRSVTVGGRIMADWSAYTQDLASQGQIGNQANGFEFRRARIFLKGAVSEVVDYKLQFDFADTQSTAAGDTLHAVTFKDVYFTVKELPILGHLRVGHLSEPFGLEELTSSKYITFMERALPSACSPERTVGVMAFDHNDRETATWALGAFLTEVSDQPPILRDDRGAGAISGRLTFLPWVDEAAGSGLWHTGVAYSFRTVADRTVRFSTGPEAHLGDSVVDTGEITDVAGCHQFGLETALILGPFSIQSEYVQAVAVRDGFADPQFRGAYVYASWFLTGESRQYDRADGSFCRIQPTEDFFRVSTSGGSVCTGSGAWEIAYRFSWIDLDDADITGGMAGGHTVGLNWYLNANTRLMFNYVHNTAHAGGTTGHMDVFQTRAQVDF